jgi:hypothetical protein
MNTSSRGPTVFSAIRTASLAHRIVTAARWAALEVPDISLLPSHQALEIPIPARRRSE